MLSDLINDSVKDLLPLIIWSSDQFGQRCFNVLWKQVTGQDYSEPTLRWTKLVHPHDCDHVLCIFKEARLLHMKYEVEYRLMDEDGQYIWILENGRPVVDKSNELLGFVGTMTDISSIKNKILELEHKASHDQMTGLYNRSFFDEYLHIVSSERDIDDSAFIFVDINGLKTVNDNYGHEAGDRLIISVASILTKIFRAGDAVCRLGGDEFGIVITKIADDDLEAFLSRKCLEIKRSFQRQNRTINEPYTIDAAIGFSIIRGQTAQEILNEADTAMYKDKGNNCRTS